MTTRRDFLRFLLGAGATAGFAGPAAFAAGPTRCVVPLGLLLPSGTAAERGTVLGLEEARRLGDLLQVDFRPAPTSSYVLIGPASPAKAARALFFVVGDAEIAARPRVYSVASSPRFRREILARHPQGQRLRVVDWHPDLDRFGADSLNLRFRRRFGRPMDERAWRGWVAVKLAAELALRGPEPNPAAKLESLSFDGHKGMPLRFAPRDHHLVQPVYLVDAKGKLVREVQPEGEA
jgi:hypothetical protein